MDGFDLVERMQAEPEIAGAPILMLSSSARRDHVERSSKLGVLACVTKPVGEVPLLEAILHTLAPPWDTSLAAAEPAGRTAGEHGPALSVLLAEDNQVNQRVLSRLLQKRGCDVVVVEDGREAVDVWKAGAFDLVLMDIQMPRMDGLEATAAIRRQEPAGGQHTPIVALTAHVTPAYRRRCKAAGMDGFVGKPVRPERLFDEIARVVHQVQPVPAGAPGGEGLVTHPNRPSFDVNTALSRVDGKHTLLRLIAEVFLETWPSVQTEIRKAMAKCDAVALVQTVAALKGSLSNFVAQESVEAAQLLQDRAAAGDLRGAQEALAMLNLHVWRLRADLESFLAKAPS
jgi:CheY-like chemotaxis protein/HPt (histidine-containing phosphotransfer) domain-containing protein